MKMDNIMPTETPDKKQANLINIVSFMPIFTRQPTFIQEFGVNISRELKPQIPRDGREIETQREGRDRFRPQDEGFGVLSEPTQHQHGHSVGIRNIQEHGKTKVQRWWRQQGRQGGERPSVLPQPTQHQHGHSVGVFHLPLSEGRWRWWGRRLLRMGRFDITR